MLNQIINGGFQPNLIITNRSNIHLFSLLSGIDCAKQIECKCIKRAGYKIDSKYKMNIPDLAFAFFLFF